MTSIAPQIHDKTVGETRTLKIDFGSSAAGEDERTGKLDDGENLTGTVTVETQVRDPATAADLTYSNAAIIATTVTINGRDALASEVVKYSAAGGEAGATYTIVVSVATDASDSQTLEGFVILKITEPS